MRIARKKKRHVFEAGGARFYSDRNFAGIGVAGDVAAACASGKDKNWCFALLTSVITGWDDVLDEDGKPLAFQRELLDGVPPQDAIRLAEQIIANQAEEAARTEKELGESAAIASSSDDAQSGED